MSTQPIVFKITSLNTMEIDITLEFNKIGKELISRATTYKFLTSELPEINNFKTEIRNDPFFCELFRDLDLKTQNCLYWFNLDNEKEAKEVNKMLDDNRELLRNMNRVVPPTNKNVKSKTLYVGIRRGGVRKRDLLSNISGRIIQHLGYYKKGSTQGLQLAHWIKSEKKAKFTLNVVELINLPNEYLNAIENIVAHQLKPLCGKH